MDRHQSQKIKRNFFTRPQNHKQVNPQNTDTNRHFFTG